MKIKFIELPKSDVQASKELFNSLLTDGEMNSIVGGLTCNGTYAQCGGNGAKNLCDGYFRGSCARLICSGIATWEIAQVNSVALLR